MESREDFKIGPIWLAFMLVGGISTMIWATLPVVVREFSWSYGVMGVLLAGAAAGYFFSTLWSGFALRHWGVRRILVTGLILQGAGVVAFGTDPRWLLSLAWMFLIGFGQGMIEVGGNFAVIQLSFSKRGRAMNLVHAAFTLGAVVAPALGGVLLSQALSWRWIYWAGAVASGLLAFSVFGQRFSSNAGEPPSVSTPHRGLAPFVMGATLVILLYVGIEVSVSSWVAEYSVAVFGGSLAMGSWIVSVYWVGILAGRLAVGLVYRGPAQHAVLVVFSSVSVLGFTLLLLASSKLTLFVSVLVTGLGLSVIYPTVMILLGDHRSADQGKSVGIVASGGGLGAFLFPLATGWLVDSTSLEWGFRFFGLMTVLMLGVVSILALHVTREKRRLANN